MANDCPFGSIRDTNRPQLIALFKSLNMKVIDIGIVPDRYFLYRMFRLYSYGHEKKIGCGSDDRKNVINSVFSSLNLNWFHILYCKAFCFCRVKFNSRLNM